MKGQEHSEKTEKRRSTEKGPPECNYAGFLTRRYREQGSGSLTALGGRVGMLPPAATMQGLKTGARSHDHSVPFIFLKL